MKRQGFFGLMVLVFAVVFGFVLLGCDTGGGGGGGGGYVYPGDTGGTGTAPSFDEIIIANSSTNARSLTPASNISVNGKLHWGIKNLNDPDKDIVKCVITGYDNGVKESAVIEQDVPALPSYPHTGYMGEAGGLSLLDSSVKAQLIGHSVYYEVYFVDSKGNKSTAKKTNTFTFTQ